MTSLLQTGPGLLSAYAGQCQPKSDFFSTMPREARIAAFVGINAFLLFGGILAAHSLLNWFAISPSTLALPLGILLAGALKATAYRLAGRAFDRRAISRIELVSLALLLGCFLAARMILDRSPDGRGYHQEAVIQFSQGWNPYHTELDQTRLPEGIWDIHSHGMDLGASPLLYVNHYPKAVEIVAASIFGLWGDIEAGKMFNLALLLASGMLCWAALVACTPLSGRRAAVLATFVAMNPVAVNQLFTYYVDGIGYSLLVGLVALFVLYQAQGERIWLLISVPVVIALANIKFTTLVFVSIWGLLALAWLLFRKRIRACLETALAAGVGLLVGVLVVGFNPYVTNFRSHGHPLYPVFGKGAIDLITSNSPQEFIGRGRFAKGYLSLLGTTSNPMQGATVPAEKVWLKVPFTLHQGEIESCCDCDTRIGGFGPLFSGILLTSLVLFVLHRVRSFWRRRKTPGRMGWFSGSDICLLGVVVGTVMIPEFWWARFAPQLWALPFLLLLPVLANGGLWARRWCLLPLGAALVSLAVLLPLQLARAARATLCTRRDLTMVAKSPAHCDVCFNLQTADRLKFRAWKIPFTARPDVTSLRGSYRDTLWMGTIIQHDDSTLHACFSRKPGTLTFREKIWETLSIFFKMIDGEE